MSTPFEPIPCEGNAPPCCAPAIASSGVCLSDGTPIAVLTSSPCAECGTDAGDPVTVGWLNLTNGIYTPGAPPAGVQVCAPQQQFEVGQWCDLAADGSVIAPVLVEYEYDENGALVDVRTLTPAGEPYDVAGTLGLCPQPAGDVEYKIMCDVQADGTVIRFIRGYTSNGDGTATADDIDVDGNAYLTTGTVAICPDCETTQVCVRPSGRVEFLTNPDNEPSGVDSDWMWSPSLAGPWWPTYRLTGFPGWTTVDGGTAEGQAHWVAPHPGGGLFNTGLPGEGPDVPAPPGSGDWYVRAAFNLPANADPASIRISTTALNADQVAVDWRLNGGPVQAVNRNHTQPPYVLPPTAVPGAQAGLNEVIVHVRETVPGGGAAGLLLHVIAEYDVDASAFVQWTRVTCSDGTVYYLDDSGVRQDELPAGWSTVPCEDRGATPLVLGEVCYDAGGGVTRTAAVVRCAGCADPVVTYVDLQSGAALDAPALVPCADAADCLQCATLVLCDVTEPVALTPPAGQFGTIAGTLANGVDYSVNCASPQSGGWSWDTFPCPNDADQTWTFSRPVMVEFGLKLTGGLPLAGAVLPDGVEVVSVAPDHVWDVATRTLSGRSDSATTLDTSGVSRFRTSAPVASLPLLNTDTPAVWQAAHRTVDVVVTAPPYPFQRVVCRNCDGTIASTVDTHLDTGAEYDVAGTVADCSMVAGGTTEVPLLLGTVCYDDGAGGTRTAAVVRCMGCADSTVTYADVETGRPVDASMLVPCPDEASGLTPVCYRIPPTAPVTCDSVTITELTSPDITNALVVANPMGWGVRPESTYNDDTSEAGGPAVGLGVINCNDFQGNTGVIIDYVITPPASNVTGVNLWNAFGGSLTDRDGIGSATLTLLDAGGTTLWTGPLNACRPPSSNYVTPCLTDLGAQVDGVAVMRLSNISKVPTSEGTVGPDIGWREIDLVTAGYEALLALECGGQEVTATVAGATAGLTYAGGQLTQTAGPHTLTWHMPPGYAGTVITDTPSAFDRLDFTNGVIMTVTGDGAVAFTVEIGTGADGSGVLAGLATWNPITGEPTLRDANTGQVVVDEAVIVPCAGEAVACVHCETVELADSAPAPVELFANAIDSTPYQNIAGARGDVELVTAQIVFDGGVGLVPASPISGEHLFAAGRLALACPPCGGDVADLEITGSLRFRNDGPTDAEAVWGRFSLWNGATQIAGTLQNAPLPVGASHTATFGPVSVPLADLVAGNVAVEWNVEANGDSNTQKSWTVDQFVVTATTTAPGCGRRFLRTTCRNCAGDIIDTVDTLDTAAPYAPVGDVAPPTTAPPCGTGTGGTFAGDVRQLVERCGCDDTGAGIVRYVELWAVDPGGTTPPELLGTWLDGDFDQPYAPVNPVDCPTGSSGGGTAGAPVGEVILYDVVASPGNCTPVVRHYIRDDAGEVVDHVDTDLDGNDYVPAGPLVSQCTSTTPTGPVVVVDAEAVLVCAGGVTYERRTLYESDGTTNVEYRDGAGAVVAAPAGPFTLGPCTAGAAADVAVSTGVRRVAGVAAQDIKAAFPGVQSVTLTVLAGAVAATMSDGGAQQIPAGVSLTWSVADDDDSSLAAAAFAGTAAAADYLINWTYKPTTAG